MKVGAGKVGAVRDGWVVLVSVEKGRGRRLFVVLQALLCCAHTAELTKAKLVRGSYRARTRFETFEAVKKLICEVGMGFGGQGLGEEISDLVLCSDVAESNVSCLHFLPEVMEVLDQVVGLRGAGLVLDDVHG